MRDEQAAKLLSARDKVTWLLQHDPGVAIHMAAAIARNPKALDMLRKALDKPAGRPTMSADAIMRLMQGAGGV